MNLAVALGLAVMGGVGLVLIFNVGGVNDRLHEYYSQSWRHYVPGVTWPNLFRGIGLFLLALTALVWVDIVGGVFR